MGSTSIQHKKGSVFCITNGELEQPLALKCLANPAGLAIGQKDTLYVAEAGENRILRFVRTTGNAWQMSVWQQLKGRYGPSAVAVDEKGNVYVAHFEFAKIAEHGLIRVYNEEGEEQEPITVPNGPEITSMVYDTNQQAIMITENKTKSIYKIDIA